MLAYSAPLLQTCCAHAGRFHRRILGCHICKSCSCSSESQLQAGELPYHCPALTTPSQGGFCISCASALILGTLLRMSSSFSWRMQSPSCCLYRQKGTQLQRGLPVTCKCPLPLLRSLLPVVSTSAAILHHLYSQTSCSHVFLRHSYICVCLMLNCCPLQWK